MVLNAQVGTGKIFFYSITGCIVECKIMVLFVCLCANGLKGISCWMYPVSSVSVLVYGELNMSGDGTRWTTKEYIFFLERYSTSTVIEAKLAWRYDNLYRYMQLLLSNIPLTDRWGFGRKEIKETTIKIIKKAIDLTSASHVWLVLIDMTQLLLCVSVRILLICIWVGTYVAFSHRYSILWWNYVYNRSWPPVVSHFSIHNWNGITIAMPCFSIGHVTG